MEISANDAMKDYPGRRPVLNGRCLFDKMVLNSYTMIT